MSTEYFIVYSGEDESGRFQEVEGPIKRLYLQMFKNKLVELWESAGYEIEIFYKDAIFNEDKEKRNDLEKMSTEVEIN